MTEERITWDHSYFYVDGEKFFPFIQEGEDGDKVSNSILITIPYLAEEDILDSLHKKANLAVLEGKWIVFELSFPWDKKPLFIQDASCFFSFGLWIEELLGKFWATFKDNTLAFVVFRGVVDFSSYFIWTEQQELLYQEKLGEYPSLKEEEVRSFFAADLFSEYLQRLCSFLPDTTPVLCLIDASLLKGLSLAAYMFSKERFGHLILALKNAPLVLSPLTWDEGKAFGGFIGRGNPPLADCQEPKIGVCLPAFEKMTSDGLGVLEDLLVKLLDKKSNFRIIQEGNLHESWDGIDDLIVISPLLSVQGLRKLRGFTAAGGRVVCLGQNLGLGNEIALSLFLEEV